MGMMIHRASKSDIPAWAAMRHALWPHETLRSLGAELPGLLRRRRFAAWIAEDGGRDVGFAEAYEREFANGCESQPVAFLEGIWVDKGWRRKGIGRKLVAEVQRWALKRGLSELGSDAYAADLRSRQSHKSWGFREMERVVYFRKKLKKT